MKSKMINSQLNNWQSYLNHKQQLMSMAKNVFLYEGIPQTINLSVARNRVLTAGSIAFFKDEDFGFLALGYDSIGTLDIYGEPNKIKAFSTSNGYSRELNKGEFIIIYDNSEHISLMPLIVQYAERIALCERVIDINLNHQKTPRIWKAPEEKMNTLKDLVNDVDGNVESIIAFEDLTAQDIECVLNPAPFVADKVQIEKEKILNEFLRIIGVSSLNIEKRERVITDEIQASQGGSIVMRYNRYEPRQSAIDEINKKWGLKIKIKYYDGEPASYDSFVETNNEENGGNKDDTIQKE